MRDSVFSAAISEHIWDLKYRHHHRHGETVMDENIQASWWRVAHALAACEEQARDAWAERFYSLLEGFTFLPGGRILAGAGSGQRSTLFNCFVMGVIEDSIDGIFSALKEGALTMQQGGGVGYDFSSLRPRGAVARSVGGIASGPVSFMRIWDQMCATLLSTGARRGAMMATLRCDHPDIEAFVDAKREPGVLRHFNLSVLISDAFMQAVDADQAWPLVFPDENPNHQCVQRAWPGYDAPTACRVFREVRARDLWRKIMRAAYESAEPGVLFIDRINRENNLYYRETLSATNPCGEIPLPPYGACDLGSFNLTRFVSRPFQADARFEFERLREAVPVAVRMLDNVIDVSGFPLPAQAGRAKADRRIGLGVTGLADALLMLGLDYASEAARQCAARVMRTLRDAAYAASIDLAEEKSVFDSFEARAFGRSPFVRSLPDELRAGIASRGLRNSHLLAIAPTGTISLLANCVSSGIEPIFGASMRRKVLTRDGVYSEFEVEDYACALWRAAHASDSLAPGFVTATQLPPAAHLSMQAVLQPFVDNAISKTINVAADMPFADFVSIYTQAFRLGLKGCTTFRANPISGQVLSEATALPPGPVCCGVDREAD